MQKLLADRDQAVVLFKNFALCSCGSRFDDYSDAENHLVQQHARRNSCDVDLVCQGEEDENLLKTILETLLFNLKTSQKENNDDTAASLVEHELPDKVCAVILDEKAIKSGNLRNVTCCECAETLSDFNGLKAHFLSRHPCMWSVKQDGKQVVCNRPRASKLLPGWSYRYYCPVPGCKYHILSGDHSKYFSNATLLKQHYAKVHAQKCLKCDMCLAGFPTEMYLRRHKKTACGKKFYCPACHRKYGALENLQTHCRRKNHPMPSNLKSSCRSHNKATNNKSLGSVMFFNVANVSASKMKEAKQTEKDKRGFVKIAPKPSPLHMTAAIALSELSSGEVTGKNDSGESQFLPSVVADDNNIISRATKFSQTATLLLNEQETQTRDILAGLQVSSTVTSLLNADKPLWTSSTQTSPSIPHVVATTDELLPSSTSSTAVSTSTSRAPKLGDIEQFSTETQTDDFEILLKPAEEDIFTIEAQTQFDLDDILCSNYTQTGGNTMDADSILPTLMSVDPTSVNSAETQTVSSHFSSVDVMAELETVVVNMETQTHMYSDA